MRPSALYASRFPLCITRMTQTAPSATLAEIAAYCDERTNLARVKDFPGAHNGLQFANSGKVTKIGAAVDAGLVPFQMAAERGVDFLVVHHGMFWKEQVPVTGVTYEKYATLLKNDIAVYGSHLPLDAHPEIGNNAVLARRLGLTVEKWFLPYEGVNIAALCDTGKLHRTELAARMRCFFPKAFKAMEFGREVPGKVAILTGSGRSALAHLKAQGCDTLITGELRQEHFNEAQEMGFNLYMGGHYATEVYGVHTLAKEIGDKFGLPVEFLATGCPL